MYSDEYNNEEMIQNSEETSNIDNNSSSSNKKVLWIVIAAIVLVLIVILYLWLGSGDKPDNPKPIIPQITISSQKENLSLGNSIPLKAIVTNIENAPIIWTSSNETVATVDNAGNVTGINEGTAIITATYFHTDGVPYSLSCEITVLKGDPNITLTNVSFPEGELLISEGAEHQIQVVIEPPEAYAGDIKYSSADDTIATIDQDGKIKAIKEGKTEIRLNAKDGDLTDQITVNVTKEQVDAQIIFPISSIEFDKQLLKLEVGSNPQQLSYKILPENALRNNLTWVSSDPTVASVNQGGVVSPLKVGTTEITVKSLDGEFATMIVEVIEKNVPVTGIEILNNSKDDPNYTEKTKTFNLKINETAQIFASVKPANATNKEILYKSDKESVATVDEDGFITAISKGTAKITVVSKENDSAKDEITVNVTANTSNNGNGGNSTSGSLSVSPASINIDSVGKEAKITVTTDGVTVTGCTSNDTRIVGIVTEKMDNNSCTVKANSVGSTTVTIRAGNLSATVNVRVATFSVDKTSVTLSGDTQQTIKITPSSNSAKISCYSNNPNKLTIVSTSNNSCVIKKVANSTSTIPTYITIKDSETGYYVEVKVTFDNNTQRCTEWIVSSSTEVFKNADTKDCSIEDKNNCPDGESCTVCEFTGEYKYFYIAYNDKNKEVYRYSQDSYKRADQADANCNVELAKKAANGDKDFKEHSCGNRKILNKVIYTRKCN